MQDYNKCHRCGGKVFVHRDVYGWYEQCIQCAYVHDLKSIDELGEEFVPVQEDRSMSGTARRRSNSELEPPAGLTTREKEVLELVSTGMSNRQIADTLFLSENTVKTHLHHIMLKYDFKNRAHAAAYLARNPQFG